MKPGTEFYALKAILALPDGVRKTLFSEKPVNIRNSDIDAQTRTLLRLIEIQKRQTIDEIGKASGVDAARAAYRHYYKMGAWQSRKLPVRSEDVVLPGGRDEMKARLYHPESVSSDGLLIYIHGGGGVIGDVEAYDYFNRYMADYLGAAVLFPEYGLGPENPFPEGVRDCLAMTRALPGLAERFGVSASNIIIGGESAGAMLSAICGNEAGQAGIDVKALWLLFGAYDELTSDKYASMTDYASGFGLSRDMIEWFATQYFANGDSELVQYPLPINLPHLNNLPATLLRAAEYDPLFDQSMAFMNVIQPMGVDVTYRVAEGLLHGYTNLFELIPAAKAALDEDLDWIKAAFSA
ncbi:alpha/beta hydrolase [Parvularcula sp. IMCC14364]|uniref:alpha/beta hydrolase n=1 Tax=Parvularcula sp. IMCC14364 TaxID=3067902 RepID=UPI002740D22F|nr:alpha/beta hydrolase [Parvularcula sp. IMCC14364]